MDYLKFQFRERKRSISFAADEEAFRMCRQCVELKDACSGFGQYSTILGHDIWLNLDHVVMINFLYEAIVAPFDPKLIKPSQHWMSDDIIENEPDYSERWQATFLLVGVEDPYILHDLTGGDWVTIRTTLDMGEEKFLVLTDDDGEDVAIRIENIEMVIGLELDRYSDTQLEQVSAVISL